MGARGRPQRRRGGHARLRRCRLTRASVPTQYSVPVHLSLGQCPSQQPWPPQRASPSHCQSSFPLILRDSLTHLGPLPPAAAIPLPSSNRVTTGLASPSSLAPLRPAVRALPLALPLPSSPRGPTLTPPTSAPVVGALLGTQQGRQVEIFNSFELVVNKADNGTPELDHAYFDTRREQCSSPRSPSRLDHAHTH